MSSAHAFGPATVANVAVGYDLLGFSFPVIGDEVIARRTSAKGVQLFMSEGAPEIPTDPEKNTAGAGVLQMLKDFTPGFGVELEIRKGIALSSGMGGSAASAVASVLAVNELFDFRLEKEALLKYALIGESVASGAVHGDNVAPCLYGGLVLVRSLDPLEVIQLTIPRVFCAVVHPELKISTKEARKVLSPDIKLSLAIEQMRALSGFLIACQGGDLELLKRSVVDHIIEPQRAKLIRGFSEIKKSALSAGAFACSISGAGPSLFALAETSESAEAAKAAMVEAFSLQDIEAQGWVSPLGGKGAEVIRDARAKD